MAGKIYGMQTGISLIREIHHISGCIQALMESANVCHRLTSYQALHFVMQENVLTILGDQRRTDFAF